MPSAYQSDITFTVNHHHIILHYENVSNEFNNHSIISKTLLITTYSCCDAIISIFKVCSASAVWVLVYWGDSVSWKITGSTCSQENPFALSNKSCHHHYKYRSEDSFRPGATIADFIRMTDTVMAKTIRRGLICIVASGNADNIHREQWLKAGSPHEQNRMLLIG